MDPALRLRSLGRVKGVEGNDAYHLHILLPAVLGLLLGLLVTVAGASQVPVCEELQSWGVHVASKPGRLVDLQCSGGKRLRLVLLQPK